MVVLILADTSYANYRIEVNKQQKPLGIGDVADNISKALLGASKLWLTVASIIGIGFLCAAFFKLHEHRKNPQQTPISKVFTFLILGLLLVSMWFIVEFGGSSFALMKKNFS